MKRSEVFNMDCMEYMRTLSDDYFDLPMPARELPLRYRKGLFSVNFC